MPATRKSGTLEWEKTKKSGGVENINTSAHRNKITTFETENNISLDCRKICKSLGSILNRFDYYYACFEKIDLDPDLGISFDKSEPRHKIISVDLHDGYTFVLDENIGYQSFTLKSKYFSDIQLDPVTFELIKGTDENMNPSDYISFFEGAQEVLQNIDILQI